MPRAFAPACKPVRGSSEARRRYRYYLGRDLAGDTGSGMRIPGAELETAVRKRVAALFADGLALIATAWLDMAPSRIAEVVARCQGVTERLDERDHSLLRDLVERVWVRDSRIEIDCSTAAIAKLLQVDAVPGAPATIPLVSAVRLTRSGVAMRLVHDNGTAVGKQRNAAATKLLLKARRWWQMLRTGEIDVTRLAASEKVSPAYVTRVLRLAFLSPAVVEAILAGKTSADIDGAALVATGGVPASWSEQATMMLPSR